MAQTPGMPDLTQAGRGQFDAVVDELKDERDIVSTSMFGGLES